MVIDKYVLGEGGKLNQLTVKATKGAFRWISGKSASNAYQIVTPVGSLSIRGTAVDFFVAPSGDTMAVLLNGRARFCIAENNCRELMRRCQYVTARRRDIQRTSGGERRICRSVGRQGRGVSVPVGNDETAAALQSRRRLVRIELKINRACQ